MKSTCFKIVSDPAHVQTLINPDPEYPHIHTVDMPYRMTSTWQDLGCRLGVWEKEDTLLAWAVFQPPWWNLDYAIHPSERGSSLEKEVLAWGQEEIAGYGKRTGGEFYGSVEIFEDTPYIDQTIGHLEALGFQKFDWSTVRFSIDMNQELPPPQLPEGFTIRPLRGSAETDAYTNLHRAAFGSSNMTTGWRMRMLNHPHYKPEIDLIVADDNDTPVGFCICWMWADLGQIEPLGVHPEYQGKGLGRALELAALQMFRDQGTRCVYVDHVSLNEKAIALSLQTGFKQINNAVRYYINVNDSQ